MVIFDENNLPGTVSCQPSHQYSRPAFQGSESSEDLLEVSVKNPHKYKPDGGVNKAHQPTCGDSNLRNSTLYRTEHSITSGFFFRPSHVMSRKTCRFYHGDFRSFSPEDSERHHKVLASQHQS
ncbi:hypothetical protein EMCG_02826 [[Emmonsia] crescens]|uniref:Uncharacterized protein n=1 Tax=[Emmonsia] crescens TaxID=73230 RepID=A0A0G2J8U3_9EURO|nr:hypothetical protein EMCG_02826 [Emmonsia crescens UAMH 3008]